MTLDIAKLFNVAVAKEMTISHFDGTVYGVSKTALPAKYKELITSEFGGSYLEDADYIVLFRKPDYSEMSKKNLTSLFKLTNRALGQIANSMNHGDFKTIKTEDEEPKHFAFLKITVK